MKVFFITIEDLIKYDISHIKRIMPKRFDKANAYKQEKDRLLCLGGAILMADIVGITNESEICFNSNGKPFAHGFPEFNISHSGDVCALVTGDKPVGIDIEKIDCKNLTIAEQVFSDKEFEWMSSDPVVRFHRLWTLKESLLKAVGTGLVDNMKSVEIIPFIAGAPVTYSKTVWYASEARYKDCIISICSSEFVGDICLVPAIKQL
ncbi:MAG: 4'-phosphopantetheinyl transferase superfamily protein [Ruminiclostridium sp.]|nr:4'-phosphopantetheinyl transferase superfamily protein [Ruminiclostridium sp.]